MKNSVIRALLALFLFIILGCQTSEEEMTRRLKEIANSDMMDILQDLKNRGIDSLASPEPYFEIMGLQYFSGDSARVFAGIAEIHYFYLSENQFYQARKYRYRSTSDFWDRYEIKLKHYFPPKDSTNIEADEDS